MPFTIRHSEETKRKISETLKRKGIKPPINKGDKLSEDHKKKLSKAKIGKVGNNKGKHWKIRDTSNFLGRIPWNRGKKYSTEMKAKLNLSGLINTKGKLNPRWKGGYENRLRLNRKRRIQKLGNGGFHTLGEWELLKKQYDHTCPSCGKSEPKITLSEDHIIPLSKGGSDNIENIQPLCRSCNSRKYDKIIKY